MRIARMPNCCEMRASLAIKSTSKSGRASNLEATQKAEIFRPAACRSPESCLIPSSVEIEYGLCGCANNGRLNLSSTVTSIASAPTDLAADQQSGWPSSLSMASRQPAGSDGGAAANRSKTASPAGTAPKNRRREIVIVCLLFERAMLYQQCFCGCGLSVLETALWPDTGNRRVQFEERGWEMGRPYRSAPAPTLDSTCALAA